MSATRIWITLSKEVYICGEPVQGTINVVCPTILSNQALKFKLKGYEETKWVELHRMYATPEQPLNIPDHEIQQVNDVDCSDDSSDSDDEEEAGNYKKKYQYIRKNDGQVYQVRRGEGSYRIINQKQELGQLTTGHHSFPFQFNTAKEWPGTFFQEQDKEKGKIKYTLKGWYGPYKTKVEFYMQEYKAAEKDIRSCTANVSAWCCVGQGKVKLDCSFAKDALYIGEEQAVTIKVDCSQLSCNISSVHLSLVNQLTFKSNEGTSIHRNNTVFSKGLQGCGSGQVKDIEEKFVVQFPQSKQANRPTCHGSKITSQYVLYVSAGNDATCACCSDAASVGNDTHIFSRPSALQLAKPVVDPNFNPKVYPVLNIAIVSANQKKIKTPPPANQNNNQVHPQTTQQGGMQQPVMNNQFQQPPSQNQGLVQNQGQQGPIIINPQQNHGISQQQPIQQQQPILINQQQNHGISQQQPIQQQAPILINQQQNHGISQQPVAQQQAPIHINQQYNQGISQQQPIQQQAPILINQQQNQGIGQQQPIYQQAPIQIQPQQNQGIGQQQPQFQQQPIINQQQPIIINQQQNQGISQQQPIYQQAPVVQQQQQQQPAQQNVNQGISQQQPTFQQQPPVVIQQQVQQQGISQQQQPVQEIPAQQQQQNQQKQHENQGLHLGQQQHQQGGIFASLGQNQQQHNQQQQQQQQQEPQQSGPGRRNFGAASANAQQAYN